MSELWYKPKIKELEDKIKVILQEKVKPGLDENKVYAETISREVLKLFKEYELKIAINVAFPLLLLVAIILFAKITC